MHRELLGKYRDQRLKFNATVGRTGHLGVKSSTLVLQDVRLDNYSNEIVASHVWVRYSKYLQRCGLKYWDKISFDANVGIYFKGNFIEYNLTDLANVQKIVKKEFKDASPLLTMLPKKGF